MPTKTKFQQLVKRIEGSNKAFAKASKAQKIVIVAKDVLAILAARRIKAVTGTYVSLERVPQAHLDGLKDMSELMKLPSLPACNVCAIGAAMFATTLRLDHVPIESYNSCSGPGFDDLSADYSEGDSCGMTSDMSERARDVFPHSLLRCMEYAFEEREHGYNKTAASGRLKDIYTNLVKNKGKKFTDRKTGEVVWKA